MEFLYLMLFSTPYSGWYFISIVLMICSIMSMIIQKLTKSGHHVVSLVFAIFITPAFILYITAGFVEIKSKELYMSKMVQTTTIVEDKTINLNIKMCSSRQTTSEQWSEFAVCGIENVD